MTFLNLGWSSIYIKHRRDTLNNRLLAKHLKKKRQHPITILWLKIYSFNSLTIQVERAEGKFQRWSEWIGTRWSVKYAQTNMISDKTKSNLPISLHWIMNKYAQLKCRKKRQCTLSSSCLKLNHGHPFKQLLNSRKDAFACFLTTFRWNKCSYISFAYKGKL